MLIYALYALTTDDVCRRSDQAPPKSPSTAVTAAGVIHPALSQTGSEQGVLRSFLNDLQPVNSHASLAPMLSGDASRTDFLCPRPLMVRILEHYLLHLYPLIPLVHRPSFWRGVMNARDSRDPDFLGLEIAICAAVVGTMPSKFAVYQSEHSKYPFESRRQLLYCCYDKLMALRGQDYFDEINYNKWAIAYLMAIAFFQIGEHNRARMIDVESMQLGRLLHLHRLSEYEGLNCIETQLRKKGFWLLFYAYM